jgi:large subunit ribosomal protein L28
MVELRLTAASNCAFNVKRDGLGSPKAGPKTIRLTSRLKDSRLRGFFRDMKVCHITGSRAVRGSVIHRRGLAKKKGGVGRHITKVVPRIFAPNLRRQRIWVPELKKFVRVRVTARGLKTINKHGAYKALKKAGAI